MADPPAHLPGLAAAVLAALAVLLLPRRSVAERLRTARGNRSRPTRLGPDDPVVVASRPSRPPPGRRSIPGHRSPAELAPAPAALVLDLVASVIEAGAPPSQAVQIVAACLDEAGDPIGQAIRQAAPSLIGATTPGPGGVGTANPAVAALRSALELAQVTGLAPSALVRTAAEQERRRRTNAQTLAARRLTVFVVVPMALCLLPAFMLLTIAPVVLDLLLGS